MTAPTSLPYGDSPPDSWNVTPLKHLATLSNGYAFKSDTWEDVGIPILRIENLNGSEKFNYSSLTLSDRHQVTAGDLLYSWSGNPGTSFGPFRWSMPGRYFLNQHIFKVSVHGCDKNWLYWALKAATHWIERERTSGMIGMVHVTKEELGSTPIPIPPLEKQRRIADFLDAETGRIDRIRVARSRTKELLQLRRERVIEHLIGQEGDNDELVPLKHLVALVTVGIVVTPAAWYVESDGVPALRGINVKPGRIDTKDLVQISHEGHLLHRKSQLKAGDLVVVRTGQAGAAAVVPPEFDGANCIDLVIVRPGALLVPRFAEYLMNSSYAKRRVAEFAVGSIQSHFNVAAMKAMPVPRKSLGDQRRIVAEIDRAIAPIEEAIRQMQRQDELLEERRRALITAAVTGQIDATTARGVDI